MACPLFCPPIERKSCKGYCNHRSRERWRQNTGKIMADIWNRYEPTAARKRGRPGREMRPKSLTVDMHAHVAIPQAAELVKGRLDPTTVPLDHFSTQATKDLMAKQANDIGPGIRATDVRFKVMDEMGVDMQLICPGP